MAIALRGYTQAVYASSGSQTVAWPAGTVVGDFAVLCMLEPQSGNPNSTPADATVWKVGPSTGNTTVWGAPVTAAMLASSLAVTGNVAFLATFSGCGGIGRTSKTNGVQVTNADGGLFVFVRDDTRTSTLTPAGGKLGTDVLNGKNRNRRSNVWFVAQTSTGFKKLSSTNASYFTSLELLPAVAPSPTTLISPANNAYINPSVANTFTGRHNHPTMPQSRINLRIREKTGPGSWLYLWANGTLNATSSSVASSVTSMTMASGQLSSGVYEWQMQTAVDNSGTPLWSDLAATLSTVNVAPDPVVNSVTVSAPAGDLTPTVTATRTLGVGSQVAWQLRVTPSASTASDQATMWDSLTQPGADLSWDLPALDWVNGASAKAWVRIQQTGGQWSAWTSGTFTVSWTAPGAPSSISWVQGAPPSVTVAGLGGRNFIQVAYSEDSGVTWTIDSTLAVTGSTMTIALPLAAYGVARRYRARASVTIDSTEQYSAWTQDQPVELRRNLIQNPRGTSVVAGWSLNNQWAGSGGTVTVTTVNTAVTLPDGTSLPSFRRKTWTVTPSAGAVIAWQFFSSSSNRGAVAAGQTYTVQYAWRKSFAGTVTTNLFQILFYDAESGGNTVGIINGPALTNPAPNVWQQDSITFTVPAGATHCTVTHLYSISDPAILVPGVTFDATAALAEPAPAGGKYFDGEYSPDPRGLPSWTGAANGSPSILSDNQASTDRGAYLVGDDGTYLAVRLRQDAPRRRVQPISVTYGLTVDGAAMAAVDMGPVQGWEGSTTLLGVLPADQAALIAFWDAHLAFIIRWPAEVRGASIYDAGRTRVARVSEVESARIVQIAATPRDLNFDWVEQ